MVRMQGFLYYPEPKAAKSMSTFDFSTLCTKIRHDKLMYLLYEITDFAFKGATRDYGTVYKLGAFWSRSKSKTGRSYSFQEIKSYLKVLINNSFFQKGSKIFREVIGIIMGSNPVPFFGNSFSFFYESRWLKSIKNTNYGLAKKFVNIFRFIDHLIAINDGLDGKECENYYNEIYPPELILKEENTSPKKTTFLDLHLCINEGQIQTSFYDKRNSYNFNVVRFPCKISTIPLKMFFATISTEIFRICRATSSVVQFIKTSKVFLR